MLREGEVRYVTPSNTLPTRYTFTGQYSHVADEATDLGTNGFGLLFYNARWPLCPGEQPHSQTTERGFIILLRSDMQIEEIKKVRQKLYQIAARHGISRVFVFGSVARGESTDVSDVDFLIEMEEDVSALGVGAFQYEAQQLLGIHIDVIPTFALQTVDDQEFVRSVQADSVAL